MKYIMPDYNNGLVNVMSSIQNYFGIKNNHNSLTLLDEELTKTKPKNVILMLFDGFGYELLIKNKDICPYMYSNLKGHISSTFPSTTMSARTTVESGLNPVEHGWMGWDMYFRSIDKVISLSTNKIKETKEVAADYSIARKLLKYETIIDKVNKLDNCSGLKISVYKSHHNESLFKMRIKIKRFIHSKNKNYIYAYYNEPDSVMHHSGTTSNRTIKELKKIDRHFEKLCKNLKDTMVIALADHGHIDSQYINLSDYPNIINMLDRITSIDSRAVAFYVKKEYKKEFALAIKEVIKDDFVLKTKEEMKKEKFYGDGKENKYFNDGLGDYFAIGITNKAIRYSNKTKEHISSHSGLTKDEMLVPLIIVNKK